MIREQSSTRQRVLDCISNVGTLASTSAEADLGWAVGACSPLAVKITCQTKALKIAAARHSIARQLRRFKRRQ